MSKEEIKRLRTKIQTPNSNHAITLIALIITIIVMLILTGVTLSITLGDNGLVNKAKEATEATEIAMDRELLLSAVVGAIGNDGKVNLSAIILPEGFAGSNGTYTSKNGHTFTVNENGEISYTGSDNVIENGGDETVGFNWESVNLDVDTNTEYICSEEGITLFFEENGTVTYLIEGLILATVDATNSDNIKDGKINCLTYVDGGDAIVKLEMNENNIDVDTTMIWIDEDGNEYEPWTFTCKKTIVDNETIYSNNEVLNALGITDSTGIYRGTWTKIGTDANGNAKLVSTTPTTSYTLGYEDPNAIGANDFEKAVWSYKNAVNSLNVAAQEATGITGARSIKVEDIYDIIGEENVDKGIYYGIVYNYYYNTETSTIYSKYKTGDNTWSEPYNTTYSSSQTFLDDNGNIVIIDSTGDEITRIQNDYTYNYELTNEQKSEIGILALGYYWLASPCINCGSGGATYRVHSMEYGMISRNDMFNSNTGVGSKGKGVCAIIVVPGL